jgi:transposase
VEKKELSISEASRQFGFSRTAYYKVERRFLEAGVDGLCLQKTGPKSPAKVTRDVLSFASDLKTSRPNITNDEIIREIQTQKGVLIHKRSLQRERAKKKHF